MLAGVCVLRLAVIICDYRTHVCVVCLLMCMFLCGWFACGSRYESFSPGVYACCDRSLINRRGADVETEEARTCAVYCCVWI